MGVGLSLFLLRHLQPSLFGKPCWCVNRQQELSIKRGHHLRPPPSSTLTSAPQDFLRQTRLQGGPAGPIHLQPLTAMGTAFRPQAKGDRLNKEGRFDRGYASAAQWSGISSHELCENCCVNVSRVQPTFTRVQPLDDRVTAHPLRSYND